MKNFSFFIRGVARILTRQGKFTKRGHRFLWGPHNGAQVENILKLAFEKVSKINYILLVSGHLKNFGYSLNPKYRKKSGHDFQQNLGQGRGEGGDSLFCPVLTLLFIKMVLPSLFTKSVLLNNKDISWFVFARYGARVILLMYW